MFILIQCCLKDGSRWHYLHVKPYHLMTLSTGIKKKLQQIFTLGHWAIYLFDDIFSYFFVFSYIFDPFRGHRGFIFALLISLHYFAFTVSKCCLICWYYNKLVQFTFLFGLFLSFVHWLPSDSQHSRLYWWKCGFIFSCFSLNWSAVDVVFLLFYDATNCILVS